MVTIPDTLTTSKALHTRHINAPHIGAVIRQQRSQWPAHNLGAIHDRDGSPEQAVTIRQDRVVDTNVLENLDDSERRARKQGFLGVRRRIQEADVLVHIEEVAVREAFDIFRGQRELLEVRVMARVEDGEVDDDAIDLVVGVGSENGVFQFFLVEDAEIEIEAAVAWKRQESDQSPYLSNAMHTYCVSPHVLEEEEEEEEAVVCADKWANSLLSARLRSPICIHLRRGIGIRQEPDQQRLPPQFLSVLPHLLHQLVGHRPRQNDLAIVLRLRRAHDLLLHLLHWLRRLLLVLLCGLDCRVARHSTTAAAVATAGVDE